MVESRLPFVTYRDAVIRRSRDRRDSGVLDSAEPLVTRSALVRLPPALKYPRSGRAKDTAIFLRLPIIAPGGISHLSQITP
jgi:hypothetical protein